jgi:large subunit ribosomal protein L24
LNVIIPWPDTPDPEEKVHPVDTPRQDLQEQTFVPTLLNPPMPADMINQLRNQYSRFRTRHEDWYLAQKDAEEAEKKKLRQFAKEMRTPQQELGAKIKAEKKARGEPELTEEMLGKIGEIMARSQGLDLKGVEAKLESLSK